ncbi:nitrate reductase associated protein [Leptolyngbya sp. 'hensonii']|uniref:nitrate reductase associated protein n=1 Tax=Leptolyngbya sp. 'hensonii' TaxID=1922337 RepID=UPI00095033F0|nr:nitrate reductase associated protein [Leptolyngbya sp. 'hensonii']OLP18054.1 nitrate reductase associated protein [Leptolyngbya sp. 'hensonii']
MTQFFQFEADFVDSLRCIPMMVRYKLDTAGIKLKLQQWNQFTPADRQSLLDRPCNTESEVQVFQTSLQQLIQERTGETATELPIDPHPPWQNRSQIPQEVQAKAQAASVTITLEQWAALTPLQRFALIKLSQSSHEGGNFRPALREFGL